MRALTFRILLAVVAAAATLVPAVKILAPHSYETATPCLGLPCTVNCVLHHNKFCD